MGFQKIQLRKNYSSRQDFNLFVTLFFKHFKAYTAYTNYTYMKNPARKCVDHLLDDKNTKY